MNANQQQWPWPTAASQQLLAGLAAVAGQAAEDARGGLDFTEQPEPGEQGTQYEVAASPRADLGEEAEAYLKLSTGARPLVGVFDSMEEFMHAALNPPAPGNQRKTFRSWITGESGARVKWFGLEDEPGFHTVKTGDVCRLVSRGWERGAARLEKAFEAIECTVKPRSLRRARVRADQGDALDIHLVNQGCLEQAWERCATRNLTGPMRVTLVCDAIAVAWEGSEAMFWRGAAVSFLADRLTRAGYAVRVVSAWQGGLDCGSVTCRVQVKSFTSPLDLATLAAGMALPAFFRSIGHTWGCGWAAKHSNTGFDVYNLKALPGEILMSQAGARDQASAARWIVEQLAKLETQTIGEHT